MATRHLLHSLLILESLAHQALGLGILKRTVSDRASAWHLVTNRRMRIDTGRPP